MPSVTSLSGITILLMGGCAMRAPAQARTFHVSDYGAQADSAEDVGQGLRAAVAAAMDSGGPAEVVLDAGVYRVGAGPGGYALSLDGARDVALRGWRGETELVITDPTSGGIRISNCERVSVAGLVIDYDPLPYLQGTVAGVNLDAQTFDIDVDPDYIEPDDPVFAEAKAKWGIVVRPAQGGRPTQYGPTVIRAASEGRLEGRRWRMHVDGESTGYPEPLKTSGMKVGDRYAQPARNYAAGVWADQSDDLLLESITLHASPGLAFCPYLCGRVTIRDCHVQPRPGTDRLLSTNADGIHCRGSRKGVVIEGCSFEGMTDDAINIHSSPIPVLEVVSPTELIVQKLHYTLRVGDRLEVMDSGESSVRAVAVVRAIEDLPDRWAYRVTLDRPVEGVRGGNSFDDADNLYNLSECATGSVVRGCHCKSYRGRGVLLSCAGCQVLENTFDVTEGWGVVLYHEATRWAEGPLARDITVEGNTFNGHGGYMPAIYVYPSRRDGTVAEARVMRDLLIRGNRFLNLGVPAVELHSCRGVRIVDNVVRADGAALRPRQSYSTVDIENCAGVQIAGLEVDDMDARHVAAVDIGPSTALGERGVSVSDVTTRLAPTSVEVVDHRDGD